MGEEGVLISEAHVPSYSRKLENPSPKDLQLLNANPLAQIISTETIADVIIDDAEACTLLDS